MGCEAFYRLPVTDDKALKTPLFSQHIVQKKPVARRGDAVQVHIRGHQRSGASLHGGMKGRQIDVPQLLVRDVCGVIVAAAFGCAIPGKMFHARQNVIRAADRIALEAAHLSLRHARTEIGIFPGAFHDAPPARISCDVHHRCKGPSDADGAGLSGRHALRMLRYGRIPRGSERERNGIDRAQAMNNVVAED